MQSPYGTMPLSAAFWMLSGICLQSAGPFKFILIFSRDKSSLTEAWPCQKLANHTGLPGAVCREA